MTIILSNHSFKYETEAIAKLFIPAQRFNFLFDDLSAQNDDYIFTRIKKGRNFTCLYAASSINGKKSRKACKINNSDVDYTAECELELCRMVYLTLQKLTGITPKWGMLTGVRPVKKVIPLIEEGLDCDEITKKLNGKYLTSVDKLGLAYKIAQIQLPLLNSIKKDAVSLYVSIPFCPTRCSYCSFVSHSMDSAVKLMPDYIECLCRELEIIGELVRKYKLTIDTIYFGGGTPTSISAEHLKRLMTAVKNSFDISAVREYNVEAGRADTITAEKLNIIKSMGATRISVNPQTLNNDVLKAVGRNHTAEQIIEAYKLARSYGFDNINMDLIAGLPTDTAESFRNTLDRVIGLSPESITVHTLTLKRSANLYESGKENVHNPATEMVDYAGKKLVECGYLPYYLYRQKNTIDNLENVGYAKKGYESLYNIFIMDEIQTILGAGCAASTKLVSRDGQIQRVLNYKFPYEYIRRFDELMDKKEAIHNFFTN